MSIRTTTYVGYGAMLPYPPSATDTDAFYDSIDAYSDNRYKEEIGNQDGVTILLDGMYGEFCFVGHIIAKSELDMAIGNVEIPRALPASVGNKVVGVVSTFQLNNNPMGYRLRWHVVTICD